MGIYRLQTFTKSKKYFPITKKVKPKTAIILFPLQWHYNERGGVSNYRRIDCLLNRFFRRRSKKTSKLSVTCLCEGNSPMTGEAAQRACNAENVSILWRHHALYYTLALETCCIYAKCHMKNSMISWIIFPIFSNYFPKHISPNGVEQQWLRERLPTTHIPLFSFGRQDYSW